MGNYSRYFTASENLSQFFSRIFIRKGISPHHLRWLSWITGVFAPVPLLFHNAISGSFFSVFAAILLYVNILSFYLIHDTEEALGNAKEKRAKWIIKPAGIFLWYGIVLCGTLYAEYSYRFFRYYNLLSLLCLVSCIGLIYGYLKWTGHPLQISRFAQCLEKFGKENEQYAPKNYISFAFGLLKPDLLALVILLLSIINFYALYIVYTLASIGVFIFTIYSLLLMMLSGHFSRSTSC